MKLTLHLLILALLLAAPTASHAQNLRQPPTPTERAYAARIGWAAAATQLGGALTAAYQPGHGGAAGSVGNTAFQSWLLLYQWCELLSRAEPSELTRFFERFFFVDPSSPRPGGITFVPSGRTPHENLLPLPTAQLKALASEPEAVRTAVSHLLPPAFSPGSGSIADALNPDFLHAMTGDETFLRAFLPNLSNRDYAPAALKILETIWLGEPKKWADYRTLAIAIALVRDQQPPAWWPHSQVQPADVPRNTTRPLDEFRFWIASNESQRLYNDLRQLDVEELKFVIDAPIAASELEWAQKNARFPRADFGRAFSSIAYRSSRLEAQAYTWNDGPYTLAAIHEHGGICVDQAYFAMLSGKARGLPTLYFTGQGTDGGHAWFGYLKSEGRWDMDCGRYENQNYAVGEALDPQDWLPINDHELAFLAQSFRRTPAYLASQNDLTMAGLFAAAGDPRRELAALDSAISVSPRNDLAWAAKGAFLDRTHAPSALRRAFHEDAIKQFSNNDDLKVSHQRALAALSRDNGDEASAQALETKIISQNRRTRSDLSVNAAATRLAGLVDAKKYDDAFREYRNLLSRLGRTSGGNFFYEIVVPFTHALARSGDISSARRAVDAARTTLRPESGSILDQDFTALESSLSPPAAGSR